MIFLEKLPRLTGREICKIVERAGFVFSHITGSHWVYKNSDGRRVTIPVHGNEEVGPGLLNKIIKKDLLLTREEFFKLLK